MTEQRGAASVLSAPPDAVLTALQCGDGPGAARLAEAALRQGLVHPLLYDLRARRAQSEGRLPQALEDFRAAARLAPESADLQQAQGAVLLRLGRWREARAWGLAVGAVLGGALLLKLGVAACDGVAPGVAGGRRGARRCTALAGAAGGAAAGGVGTHPAPYLGRGPCPGPGARSTLISNVNSGK